MLKTPLKFTYQEYIHLSDDKRYEVIDGGLYMVPGPDFHHQIICCNIAYLLRRFVEGKKLGLVLFAPFDVVLSEDNVVQPDIMFVSKERRDIITERNITGAPDLIIEILSASNKERDKLVKKFLYASFKVKEYWIVDPWLKSIEVMTPGERGYETYGVFNAGDELISPLLSDLDIPIAEIFKEG